MLVRSLSFIGLVLLLVSLSSCITSPQQQLAQDSSEQQSDSEEDPSWVVEEAAEHFVSEMARSSFRRRFEDRYARSPVLIVGAERSSHSIPPELGDLSSIVENGIVSALNLRLVASSQQREMVRQERIEQQTEASEQSLARLGREAGADFFVVLEPAPRSLPSLITIDASVIDVESTEVVLSQRYEVTRYDDPQKNNSSSAPLDQEDQSTGLWRVAQSVDQMTDEITTTFSVDALRGHESYELTITHVAPPSALLAETTIQVTHPDFTVFIGNRLYAMIRFDEQPAWETRWRVVESTQSFDRSAITEPGRFLRGLRDSEVLRTRITKSASGREYSRAPFQDAGFATGGFGNALRSTGLSFDDLLAGVEN